MFFRRYVTISDMDAMNQPFSVWEAVLYAFLNAFPYMVPVLYAFRSRWRFGRGMTFSLTALIALLMTGATTFRLLSASASSPLYDVAFALLYVVFIFLTIRDHIGKLAFTVLVLTDLGNLVVVLSKCIEGQLFPALAPLRYHFTFSLVMLAVELILLPVIYRVIFRGIASGDAGSEETPASRYMWRYLWLIPAVFYLIWVQHFYASGRSALENALDPVSTGYLLLIDAGSVLIYRLIIRLVRTESNNRRLMAENHALSLQSVQYDHLRKRIDETRQARHDLRHHIMLLKNIRDNRDFDALDKLLRSYPDLADLDRPLLYCRNEMVNAILAHFGDRALEKGIRYSVKLDVPEDVFMEKPDLAVLFGNLLENAVEACSHTEADRFISVSGGVSRAEGTHESLTLVVENSCSAAPLIRENGVFQSTKHSGDGVGISSVRSIAERYGGASSFAEKDGVFTASVILYSRRISL